MTAAQQIRKLRTHAKQTAFMVWCMMNALPKPTAEFRFHPTRRWRFDWCWPEKKIALEIEGGVWTGGRHTRGAGFVADMEKYNASAALGWRLIRVTPSALMTRETLAALREILQ